MDKTNTYTTPTLPPTHTQLRNNTTIDTLQNDQQQQNDQT